MNIFGSVGQTMSVAAILSLQGTSSHGQVGVAEFQ